MKYFFLFLFFANRCYSQDVELSLQRIDTSNLFLLKILNGSVEPIGIKCSIGFASFTENDTLNLSIGEWYNSNGVDYYYGIEKDSAELLVSENNPYYQLFLLNPQSYLITKVYLSDLEQFRSKNILFSIVYTKEMSNEEVIKFAHRNKIGIVATNANRLFKAVFVKF